MTEYVQVVTAVDSAEEAAAVTAPLAQNFELTIGDARQPPGNGTPQRWPGPISCRSSDRAPAAMSVSIQ